MSSWDEIINALTIASLQNPDHQDEFKSDDYSPLYIFAVKDNKMCSHSPSSYKALRNAQKYLASRPQLSSFLDRTVTVVEDIMANKDISPDYLSALNSIVASLY